MLESRSWILHHPAGHASTTDRHALRLLSDSVDSWLRPYAVSWRTGLVRRATLSSSPPPYAAVKFRLAGTALNRGVFWIVVTVSDTGIVMGGPESPNGV